MADVTALSTEDRVAIDRLFERLNGRTHYELLAVALDSSWEAIDQAARDLRKRMDASRFVGIPSGEYQRRVECILRAIDQAVEVLGDPVRRFLYDQQLRRGEGRRGETQPPPRPAATPVPPKPPAGGVRDERVPSWTPEARPSSAPSDAPLVVPAPLRKSSFPTPGDARPLNSAAPPRRPSFPTQPMDGGARANPVGASPATSSADRRDLDTLLVEVERIAVSVQFCIAQMLDPQAARVTALQTAGQALADTRAALAGVQARRDEEAGRWPEAVTNWVRASRANPHDAGVLVRLAECHQRLGDAVAAEDSARRALAIDPASEGARLLLSSLGRR
jgi:tetratricopeptide (TPR) repeat protein